MKTFLLCSFFIAAVNCLNSTSSFNTIKKDSLPKADTSGTGNEAQKNETLAGEWYLQPVLASDTASGKLPWLKFNLSDKTVNGFSGCNSINGNFIAKGESLSFNKQMISTKMACPGYNEKTFMNNLIKTNRYQIKQGILQLMYNTTNLSNWVRHADTATTRQL